MLLWLSLFLNNNPVIEIIPLIQFSACGWLSPASLMISKMNSLDGKKKSLMIFAVHRKPDVADREMVVRKNAGITPSIDWHKAS